MVLESGFRPAHFQIPTDLCPEIFISISHLHHLVYLDVFGNNLSRCLPNFLSDSDSVLPSLQRMYLMNTALTVHDVNHIIYIIETGKLQNLEMLDLYWNNLRGMEAEVDRLINTTIIYHKEELFIKLPGKTFSQHLVEKWQSKCSGTVIKFNFMEYNFFYQKIPKILTSSHVKKSLHLDLHKKKIKKG